MMYLSVNPKLKLQDTEKTKIGPILDIANKPVDNIRTLG